MLEILQKYIDSEKWSGMWFITLFIFSLIWLFIWMIKKSYKFRKKNMYFASVFYCGIFGIIAISFNFIYFIITY